MVAKTFRDYIGEKFAEDNPGVLDDIWVDMQAEWEAGLDVQDVIRWADEWAALRAKEVSK